MIELLNIHHSRHRTRWPLDHQPVASPSATLVHASSNAKNHKVQASGERRIYAVAIHVRVRPCDSRIGDPNVAALRQHRRTVLMDRVWGYGVAFGAMSRHTRLVARQKHCTEVPDQPPSLPD